MNEARLREIHHRVIIPISGGLKVTVEGKREEIISSTVTCCSCLNGNWEAGPCETLIAIEDDMELKDVVEIVTWGGEVMKTIEVPLEDVYGGVDE